MITMLSMKGVVEVIGSHRDSEVVLTVRNSGGAAVWRDMDSGSARREGGFGLRHTCERLKQLCGDRAVLELTQSQGSTVAEIRLPYQPAETAHPLESQAEQETSVVPGRAAHG
jgi:LytS/YehU family sensor histidine kinase